MNISSRFLLAPAAAAAIALTGASGASAATFKHCASVKGASHISANKTMGCRVGRATVKDYLRYGCPQAWTCKKGSHRRVTLSYKGGVVRFTRKG
jgi:hypothetical protein